MHLTKTSRQLGGGIWIMFLCHTPAPIFALVPDLLDTTTITATATTGTSTNPHYNALPFDNNIAMQLATLNSDQTGSGSAAFVRNRGKGVIVPK